MNPTFLVIWVASAISSATPTMSLLEADTALKNGDYRAAIVEYRRALEKDPKFYEARYGLARALSLSGERSEAISLYSDLLGEHPGDPDALVCRGRVYAWEKRYEEAEKDLKIVTENHPDYADAWSALGDVYLWSGHPESAIAAYTQWIERLPDQPAPYLARAKAYRDARRFAPAREDFHIAESKGEDTKEIQRELRELDRIRGALPWELAVSYSYLNFSPSTTDWNTITTAVRHHFSRGSIALESLETRRFSEWDHALAFDGYLDLWERAYGNFRFQATPDAKVLARNDAVLELFQGFGKGWEVSGSYRYMDFPHNQVDLYGIAFAKTMGDWALREKTYFTSKNGEFDLSQTFSLRRYFGTPDDYLQVDGGWGKEEVTLGSGFWIESRKTHSISVGGQKFLSPRLGVSLSLIYSDIEGAPIRRGVTFGIITRW